MAGMSPPMRSVFSTMIRSIGYDEDAGELHVNFNTGRTVVFRGVPADVARQVTHAPSIGTAFNQAIRGRFDFHYPDEGPHAARRS